MRRGTNLPALGGYNQAVVLDLIRRSPDGVSRVELAGRSGLSPQTVSNVVRRLLETGLVREGERHNPGRGKPRTLLNLEPRGRVAVGVHLDPSVVTSVVVDLTGSIVARSTIPTPSAVSPDEVIASMVAELETLLAGCGIPRDDVLGLGIAAPGPIDRERGVIDDPPLLPGWVNVPLRDALGEALRMPVALEKDVTAAAVGELWSSEDTDRDDVGFFYYGTGVGFGLGLDHAVMRGATANLGDVGHLLVSDTGPLCRCGRRGCIGENVSPMQLVAEAARAGILDAPRPDDPVGLEAAFDELVAAAQRGDAVAVAMLDRVARDLAHAVVLLANLLDLSTVIFNGPFWVRAERLLLPRVRAAVAASRASVVPHPVALSSSALGADATAVGAGCQVLDATFSPSPSALLI